MAIRTCLGLTREEVDNAINGTAYPGFPTQAALDNGDTCMLPREVAVGGTWNLTINGTTQTFPFNATTATIKTFCDGVIGLGDITIVEGDYYEGLRFEFKVAVGAPVTVASTGNALTPYNLVTITQKRAYKPPNPPAVAVSQITLVTLGLYWTDSVVISKSITVQGVGMFEGNKTRLVGHADSGQMFSLLPPKYLPTPPNPANTLNDFILTIIGIHFHNVNRPATGAVPKAIIRAGGTSCIHMKAGGLGGGWRILECRWSTMDKKEDPTNSIVTFTDWSTGLCARIWTDFPLTYNRATYSVFDLARAGAPGFVADTNLVTDGSGTYAPAWGQYVYSTPYIWGGGPDGPEGDGVKANGDNDAIYVEDCLTCRNGGITDGPGPSSGSKAGGGIVVYRYNTDRGSKQVHGYGESGASAGCYVFEAYNNYMVGPPNPANAPMHTFRSGTYVNFNNRLEALQNNRIAGAVAIFRASLPGGNMVGCMDGTNFFDDNARDNPIWLDPSAECHNQCAPGTPGAYSFPLDTLYQMNTPPSPYVLHPDERIGAVYKSGKGCHFADTGTMGSLKNSAKFLMDGAVPLNSGGVTDKWVGFTIRNATMAAASGNAESDGAMNPAIKPPIDGGGKDGRQVCAIILASDDQDPCTLTTSGGHNSSWYCRPEDVWELRYVKHALGVSGATRLPRMNGGHIDNHTNPAGYPNWLTPRNVNIGGVPTPKTQYYPFTMVADGNWIWDNKYRATAGGAWGVCDVPRDNAFAGMQSRLALGTQSWAPVLSANLSHSGAIRPKTAANGAPPTGAGYIARGKGDVADGDYPKQPAGVLRIGADPVFWHQADGDHGATVFGRTINPEETATVQWGYRYPHPYSTATIASPPKVISLSGNMVFGAVTVGNSVSQVLTITNFGTVAFAVSNITIKTAGGTTITQFVPSVTTIAAVNPGTPVNVNITFTPTAVASYVGTVTVVCDVDAVGANTIDISGNGITGGTGTVVWAITPGTVAFGSIQRLSTQQRNVTFVNNGTASGQINALPHDPGVSLSWTSFPRTIPANGSDVLTVTADTSVAGTFSGVINVTSNATGGADHINFNFTVVERQIYCPVKR